MELICRLKKDASTVRVIMTGGSPDPELLTNVSETGFFSVDGYFEFPEDNYGKYIPYTFSAGKK